MLKAGFIGMGRMGITHYSILNTHPDVKVVGIAENSKILSSILNNYLNINIYSDYRDMLEREHLDFVVISTPSASHADIISQTLKRDLHVFVEKPFSIDLEKGKELVRLVKEKKVANQVGYVGRFHDIFCEVKEMLNDHLIGEIKSFKAEMLGATITKDAKDSWRGKRQMGGGCLYEFSAHSIDLIINLIGKPDYVMGSSFQNVYSSGVEDIVNSTFIYENGIIGSVYANWSEVSYRKPTNRIEIFGKNGKIVADQYAYKIFLNKDNERFKLFKGWNTKYITDIAESVRFDVRGRSYTRQLDYFIKSIENQGKNNRSSFARAYDTDVVLKAIDINAKNSEKLNINSLFIPVDAEPEVTSRSFWQKFITFFR